MASTYLTRTPSSTGNRKTWTFSAWFKKFETGVQHRILSVQESGDERLGLYFSTSDQMVAELRFGGEGGTGLYTTQLFRDTSAWYHVVWSVDTTQATASNRSKLYINGEQITSFSASGYPSLNADTATNYTVEHRIGKSVGFNNPFNGLMSHIHLTDGTAYDASYFGSTDSVTGEWKINTSPSVTYGTNGFFILKDGNSVTDQSGEGNNFTVGGGTLTKTEDNPSNNFATYNSLISLQSQTYSEGNLQVATTSSGKSGGFSTIGASQGKWYAEFKVIDSNNRTAIGITSDPSELDRQNQYVGFGAYDYSYVAELGNKANNNSESSYGNSYTQNDIIGVAVDLDNNKIYFSKNGTWQNSGDPESGATGTGAAFTLTASSSTPTGFYFFGAGDVATNYTGTIQANFGNGYFGTTAVSSAGTNASGNGIFEFDCPTGFTALSTKGLNL